MNEHNLTKENPRVLHPDSVRQAIGYLGIFMPAILMIGSIVIGQCPQLQDSISHYYFTIMGNVLVATLCGFSVFLFMYKGYTRWDNIVTSFAAVCALGVAMFATSQIDDIECSVVCLSDVKFRIFTHYISAALFFITLSYISIFLFTKSKGEKTRRKIIRNRIYITCGVLMMVFLVFIVLVKAIPWLGIKLAPYKPVFWFEWFALIAFGVSWLVKGNALVKD